MKFANAVLLDPKNGRPETSVAEDILELSELEKSNWINDFQRLSAERAVTAADGLFYRDMREPFLSADQAQVTLASTAKAMYTPSAFPVLGGQYWTRGGKKLSIRAFGKITTAATPGNLTIDLYYGNGTDANGTIVVSSAAQTLVANQTNISWEVELKIHARALGSTGTLFATGKAVFGTAVIAAGTFLLPASAAVASGSADLTAANILSLQFRRSGSTSEVATVQDLEIEAVN